MLTSYFRFDLCGDTIFKIHKVLSLWLTAMIVTVLLRLEMSCTGCWMRYWDLLCTFWFFIIFIIKSMLSINSSCDLITSQLLTGFSLLMGRMSWGMLCCLCLQTNKIFQMQWMLPRSLTSLAFILSDNVTGKGYKYSLLFLFRDNPTYRNIN